MKTPEIAQQDPRIYVQVAEQLRQQIADGTYPPGSPAPSITELSLQHGRARLTMGKALRLLEHEGLLVRVPGLGYYVAAAAA